LLQFESRLFNTEESIIISREKISESSVYRTENPSFIGEDVYHEEPDLIQFDNYVLISAIIASFYKNCSNSKAISSVEEQIMNGKDSISLNYNRIREIISTQAKEKYRQNTTLSKLLGELNLENNPQQNQSNINEEEFFSIEYNGDQFEEC
jgi:hypothetical protein